MPLQAVACMGVALLALREAACFPAVGHTWMQEAPEKLRMLECIPVTAVEIGVHGCAPTG